MPEPTEIVASLPASQPLKVWERLCLVVGDDHDAGIYIARIEDFMGGNIVITSPEYVQGNTLLRDGVAVIVQVTREDAVYQFHSQIRQRSLGGANRGYLAPPTHLERVQRRRFVRIPVTQAVHYRRVASPLVEQVKCDRTDCQRATTIDISGGGAFVRLPEALAVRDLIVMQLDFLKKAGVTDCLLAVCQRAVNDKQGMAAGVEFVLANELSSHFTSAECRLLPQGVGRFDVAAQNKLVSFIFGEQISMRKKGLL